MGNAEFKSLSHVSPINSNEVLSICRQAMSNDDLLKGTEASMSIHDPWMPIDRTRFSLLFDNNKAPYQFVDQLFDAYTAIMRELGGEVGLRRPDAFTRPLTRSVASNNSTKASEGDVSSSSPDVSNPKQPREDLNEINLRAIEHDDPTARVDFAWLLMHLLAVLPHSAPVALIGDIETGLQNMAVSRFVKGAMASAWVDGGRPASAGSGTSLVAGSSFIPVDQRLSLLYDVFLRRVQRLARINAVKKKAVAPKERLTGQRRISGGAANTPTKLALIKDGRNGTASHHNDDIPIALSISDIKDALFSTVKLAVSRHRGVGSGSGRTQYPDRRCAGCQTIPTNLTFDCRDCHEACIDRHFDACAEIIKGASHTEFAGPTTARTEGSRSTDANTMSNSVGSVNNPEGALLSAAAMTAPVHMLGIPITTLLCNRCVGQYEGYGSGLHQYKHLKGHDARRSNWAPNPLQVTHIGTECSACGMTPITGTRYRCLECLDRVDLCGACHRDAEEPLCHSIRHRVWKITTPLTLDEEVNSFIEELVAPIYQYVGIPKPPHAVTRRVNPRNQDVDFSDNHNQDYSETHFTDALLTVDQRREVEAERKDMSNLHALKDAAIRIGQQWPEHISELLDDDRTLAFLEREETGEAALASYREEVVRMLRQRQADAERVSRDREIEKKAIDAALGIRVADVTDLDVPLSSSRAPPRSVHFVKEKDDPIKHSPRNTSSTTRRPLSAALQAQAAEEKLLAEPEKPLEDVAAARLARHYIINNGDDHTFISKEMFMRWGNQSEVIAALFRGFEVRHARTCTEMEGVEYTEYSSSMATTSGGVVGTSAVADAASRKL